MNSRTRHNATSIGFFSDEFGFFASPLLRDAIQTHGYPCNQSCAIRTRDVHCGEPYATATHPRSSARRLAILSTFEDVMMAPAIGSAASAHSTTSCFRVSVRQQMVTTRSHATVSSGWADGVAGSDCRKTKCRPRGGRDDPSRAFDQGQLPSFILSLGDVLGKNPPPLSLRRRLSNFSFYFFFFLFVGLPALGESWPVKGRGKC
jgi:hypothetical protein